MLLCFFPHEILAPPDSIACHFGRSVSGNVNDRHISSATKSDLKRLPQVQLLWL